MIHLYAADACPYAHRSRALLQHLQIPFELRVIDLKNKPPEFLALSPTGRVPMLVDGERKLYESAVINEYLREDAGWDEGLSRDTYQRARERLAMAQFDGVVSPAFWAWLKAKGAAEDKQRQAVDRELDELEATVKRADAPVNLLGFHVIPHVIRWRWLGDATPMPALLEARPVLSAWLANLASLPAVQTTLSERSSTVAGMRRLAGLDA